MQREECVIRPVVRDETEKQEVRDLLAACDNDFVPPLSARSSTTQQSWEGAAGMDTAYCRSAVSARAPGADKINKTRQNRKGRKRRLGAEPT